MRDRSKQLSKMTWKDPTRSLSRLAKVESKLVALFRNYRRRVLAELKPAEQPFTQMEQLTQKWPVSFSIEHFYQRLEDLTTEVLIGPAAAILAKEIPDAFTHGTKYADLNLKAKMGIKLGAPLEERQRAWQKVGALVEKSKGEFKGVSDAVNQQIRRAVADGMVNEESLSTVTKKIQDVAESVGENRARMIARTETMKAINTGVKDRYTQAGIVRYERLEAEDERTCEYCSSIDGKVFTKEEADEIDANMHPNCRGTWIISEDSLGLEEATQKYRQIMQGGAGSGNFGHAGRPGEVGGSGPGGSAESANVKGRVSKDGQTYKDIKETRDIVRPGTYSSRAEQNDRDMAALEDRLQAAGHPNIRSDESIPKSIRDAANDYKGGAYGYMNAYMRHGEEIRGSKEWFKEKGTTVQERTQSLLKGYDLVPPLPEGIKLYRGLGYDGTALLEKAAVGDIIEDKGFQSWSRNLGEPSGRAGAIGSNFAVVRTVTDGKMKGLTFYHDPEREILVKPGQAFKVVAIERVNRIRDDGRRSYSDSYIYHVAPVEERP